MNFFWNANDHWSSREGCPWTFFAYPRRLADADGLPPDQLAREILASLQARGLRVAPFTNPPVEGVAYLACHKDDIESVCDALQAMGVVKYCVSRSQELLDSFDEGA